MIQQIHRVEQIELMFQRQQEQRERIERMNRIITAHHFHIGRLIASSAVERLQDTLRGRLADIIRNQIAFRPQFIDTFDQNALILQRIQQYNADLERQVMWLERDIRQILHQMIEPLIEQQRDVIDSLQTVINLQRELISDISFLVVIERF